MCLFTRGGECPPPGHSHAPLKIPPPPSVLTASCGHWAGGAHSTGMLSCFTDVSSGEEEDAPEPVEQDEETRELRIIDPNAYVSLFVRRASLSRQLKARLHQTSQSTLRQLCDDASDTVLVEHNGVTLEWGCNPFLSDSIVFNDNSIASVIPELLQG